MRSIFLVSAAALLLSALPAHADDTYTTYNISAAGDGGGDPTYAYTAQGTVTIDTTTNAITSFYITDTLGLTLDSSVDTGITPFTDAASPDTVADFGISDLSGDGTGNLYDYILSVYMPSAGVYAVCTSAVNCNETSGEYVSYFEPPPYFVDLVDTATLTPVSDTPEPSSLALLATGILGVAVVSRRRFLTT